MRFTKIRDLRKRGRRVRGTPETPAVAPSSAAGASWCAEEREALLGICMWVFETSELRSVRQRIAQELKSVGAHLTEKDGVPPDPKVHAVMGTVPVVPGAVPGTIARVTRVGIVDRGRVLRMAEVFVYQEDAT